VHRDTVLPGKIPWIQHENVFEDLENNARRVLDFRELAFGPQCAAPFSTKTSTNGEFSSPG
jgi:hypothetical protein